ncbi:hypothetical protein [Glutamicibacter creatinolyticus]|uniref:hypothetical protein n=1 Tax=Glutamicibacter creatinolyticus TaxID=162496 RepID=UPI0031E067FB
MTILELLEAHFLVGQTHGGGSPFCTCGAWRARNPLSNYGEDHRAHLAEVLETHQQEQQARAWSDGFHKGRKTDRHISTWPRNPYRTDQTREAHDGR